MSDIEYVATMITDCGTAIGLADIAAPLKREIDYLKKANADGPDLQPAYEILKTAIAYYAGLGDPDMQFLDDAIESCAAPLHPVTVNVYGEGQVESAPTMEDVVVKAPYPPLRIISAVVGAKPSDNRQSDNKI